MADQVLYRVGVSLTQIPQLNKTYIQRAAFDENVQYLLLAMYWWFSKPIFSTSGQAKQRPDKQSTSHNSRARLYPPFLQSRLCRMSLSPFSTF